jgi:alpha-methylacyl-CoA racemase
MENEKLGVKIVSGPLANLKVLEFAGLGPAPFACMLLSDMGADVVTIVRPGSPLNTVSNITGRGRSIVIADLKNLSDREGVDRLLQTSDVLVEGFRPGVMEKLHLGPEEVALVNPRLIYARMTGWGQTGPMASVAGHDINYIALSGVLNAIGPEEGPPSIPLNLVGDYGAGSLYLVCGILAALHERTRSGRGQTIDAAIVDGAASLMSTYLSHVQRGNAVERRGVNLLDGGAPFYDVYKTRDGKFIAVGAIEPQFFALLCKQLALEDHWPSRQLDRTTWPALRERLAQRFLTKTQEEWCSLVAGTDSCVTPILSASEAMAHEHLKARETFECVDDVMQPSPSPRFSRTPSAIQHGAPTKSTTVDEIWARWRHTTH